MGSNKGISAIPIFSYNFWWNYSGETNIIIGCEEVAIDKPSTTELEIRIE
jgi:hypothetical protein